LRKTERRPPAGGDGGAGSVLASGGAGGGMIRGRSEAEEARTPAYLTVWNLGAGTVAASRNSRASGSRSMAYVPSESTR